jgi:uncharacterized protein
MAPRVRHESPATGLRREPAPPSRPRLPRLLWQGFGWLNVSLGAAGLILPLLPATPFLLLAAWSFARGSQRFHGWLINHPRLGPPISAWQQHRAIPRWAKRMAIGTLAAGLLTSLLIGVPGWALAAQLVCMAGSAAFILTRNELPEVLRNEVGLPAH